MMGVEWGGGPFTTRRLVLVLVLAVVILIALAIRSGNIHGDDPQPVNSPDIMEDRQ